MSPGRDLTDGLDGFRQSESKRCGYIVTLGFRACDYCGGGGLSGGEICPECGGKGEHELTAEQRTSLTATP